MRITATCKEIAVAQGKAKTSVLRRLNRAGTKSTWEKGVGGSERAYFVYDLPNDMRLALAAYHAAPATSTPSCEASPGTEAAEAIIRENATRKELKKIAMEEGTAAFGQLPEQEQNKALARRSFLQLADDFSRAAGYLVKRNAMRSKVGDQEFVKAYNAGRIRAGEDILAVIGETTSYSTVVRLSKRYSASGLIGLADRYHNPKKGASTMSPEQQDFVIAAMCANPQTSSKNIKRLLEGKFLGEEQPSTGVITRFRNNWIAENADLWLYYTNPDAWKNKSMFAFGSASDHISRLNQLWEADSTPADLMLVDGRHSLIGMIDVYSRRLRLLVSKTSKSMSIIALIRECLIDWGVPESIKTDNGKDYKSVRVREVLAEGLDIEQIFCVPFASWEKPHIERVFRTFSHGLVELMPNYIGHNVAERKAIEARRSFADRIMDKDGGPVEVNMTSEELQKFANEWVNFCYHQDPHSSLKGKRPIEMVQGWKEPIRRISDMRALDMLLAPAPDSRGRKIGKKGVLCNNKQFQSPEFAGHEGADVHVLLDPANLGQIFVYLIKKDGSKEFLCPAIDPVYYGLDPVSFADRAKKRQDKIKKEEVKKLNKLAKEQGVREAFASYMDQRREEAGNIVDLPKRAVEYTTDGLAEAAKAAASVDSVAREQKDSDLVTVSGIELDLKKVREEVSAPMKKSEKVTLLRGDIDTYVQIEGIVLERERQITGKELSWLDYFYCTESGKSFMALKGDLRLKIQTAQAAMAVK